MGDDNLHHADHDSTDDRNGATPASADADASSGTSDATPAPTDGVVEPVDDAPPDEDPITIHVQNEPFTVDEKTEVADLKEMVPDIDDDHVATFRGDDGKLYHLEDEDTVTDYLTDGDSLDFRFPTVYGHAG